MKKTISRFCSLFLSVVFLLPALNICPADAASASAEIESIKSKISALEKEQEQYEKRLREIEISSESALEKKTSYERQISVIEDKIESTNELIAQYDTMISETGDNITEKSEQIDARFEEFLQRMSINYEDGYVNYLVLFLDSGSVTDLLQNTERAADALEYDKRVMESLESDKKELSDTKSTLEQARAEQEQARKDQRADLATLESKKSELSAYLKKLENDKELTERLQKEAQKADDELNAKLEALLAEIAKRQDVAVYPVSSGEMLWPLPVNNNILTSRFGPRELFGYHEHRALDISAPESTPIYAVQAGKVEIAEWHYSYGNYVVINHGGGYSTTYAHAIKLNCKAGDYVQRGDVIAYVGNTGESKGNHLHIEVRYNGIPQDPLNYIHLDNMVYWSTY